LSAPPGFGYAHSGLRVRSLGKSFQGMEPISQGPCMIGRIFLGFLTPLCLFAQAIADPDWNGFDPQALRVYQSSQLTVSENGAVCGPDSPPPVPPASFRLPGECSIKVNAVPTSRLTDGFPRLQCAEPSPRNAHLHIARCDARFPKRQFNFSVQRELRSDMVVTLGYIWLAWTPPHLDASFESTRPRTRRFEIAPPLHQSTARCLGNIVAPNIRRVHLQLDAIGV
jgi:hypothetical protein